MNAVRRTAAVVGLAAAVIVGSSIPAGAAFSDSVAVQPTVATVAVAAPASVSVAVTRCHPQFSEVAISWPASTTATGVTGYRVTAYLNNGTTVVVGQTNATTRSVGATVSRSQLQLQAQVTVTTLTSYGWSTESARSAVISC